MLRWERVYLNGAGGLIQVSEGKSKAARRILPMVPEVYGALKSRWESQGCPSEGLGVPLGFARRAFQRQQRKRPTRTCAEEFSCKAL